MSTHNCDRRCVEAGYCVYDEDCETCANCGCEVDKDPIALCDDCDRGSYTAGPDEAAIRADERAKAERQLAEARDLATKLADPARPFQDDDLVRGDECVHGDDPKWLRNMLNLRGALAAYDDAKKTWGLFTSVPTDEAAALTRPTTEEIQAAVDQGREARAKCAQVLRGGHKKTWGG